MCQNRTETTTTDKNKRYARTTTTTTQARQRNNADASINEWPHFSTGCKFPEDAGKEIKNGEAKKCRQNIHHKKVGDSCQKRHQNNGAKQRSPFFFSKKTYPNIRM